MSPQYCDVMSNGHPSGDSETYCPYCGGHTERYLSVRTAAATFDLTEEAVRGMIKRREIPFFKLGSRVRLRVTDLNSALVRYPAADESDIFQNDLNLPPLGS